MELDSGFAKTVKPLVATYCANCHGKEDPDGQLDLTKFTDLSGVVKDYRHWQLVMKRVSAGEMPPEDAEKKPSATERAALVGWIQSLIQYESVKNAGDPGLVLARRLSNAEYDYTIRDLTGVDIRPTKEFPVDPANEAGFDNSGESLSMSPSLVTKYLDAARLVSEHIVFKPDGFAFAPYPVVTETDRDKYAVNRIVKFYKSQPVDYTEYFLAAWRYQHRAALGKPAASLASLAEEAKISPKYLDLIYAALSGEKFTVGPMAAVQLKFSKLPAPVNGKEEKAVRDGCVAIRAFILDLRPWLAQNFANFPARGIASGSQSVVLWKNRQFAENRRVYGVDATSLDMSVYATTDPVMLIPADAAAQAKYHDSSRQFCDVFPNNFYISERGRMFLTNPQEIENEKRNNTGRLLGAGFHSQMGYYRDDQPLCELILTDAQKAELEQLWRELDYITLAPVRQFKQFIWFERAEPPSFMYTPEFNAFRSEDEDITTEAKMTRLAEAYLAKLATIRMSDAGIALVKDYFDQMNARNRALDQARAAAEPSHISAMLAFAEKAYRRPLVQGEKDSLLAFYKSLRSQGQDHEESIRDTVMSVLMSPSFCYRVDPSDAVTEVKPMSDFALASRLSYFLWASMPDVELMSHAAVGDLHEPSVLIAQARRMIKDPRARGFATEFAGNWLDVRRFEEHNAVDREHFPQFTNDLRAAMFDEPIRYFMDVAKRDGSILDFLYGDYTFVNPLLAKHYGIPVPEGVGANDWFRVDRAGQYQRGGLLPMSVFLTKNAPGLRTSPVKRGYWVVRRILGEEIPAPPPNVPVLPTKESDLGDMTLRQALAKHREDKSCATCHERFDSVGVVFEGFGPIGEWRKQDLGGRPVETSVTFPGGSNGDGIAGLRTYIHDKRQAEFVDNFCRKLLTYAIGRSLLPSDEPLIAELRSKLESNQYRFGDAVERIITSKQFLNKRGTSVAMKE